MDLRLVLKFDEVEEERVVIGEGVSLDRWERVGLGDV